MLVSFGKFLMVAFTRITFSAPSAFPAITPTEPALPDATEPTVLPEPVVDIAELRESGYCQYGYIDEEDNIIVEMTEQQKEEWLNYTVNDINRIIGQGEEGFYSFKFTHNYEELQLEISKEILNGKTTTHTALVMSLIYDSEIYQVLNGKTDWAIHIVGKDLETGGELMNINFPEEGYHISIENWDNM